MRREREERRAGRTETAALEAAAATSGRAVLVSGITVLIAMAGMFLSGDKTFMSFSVGTMIVVAVAMIGSLTVLPAILGRLGDKVEKGKIPFTGRKPPPHREPHLGRHPRAACSSTRSSRRSPPAQSCSSWPLPALEPAHLADRASRASRAPRSSRSSASPTRSRAAPDPAVVAIKADDVNAPQVKEAIAELKQTALATGEMNNADRRRGQPRHTVATVSIPLAGCRHRRRVDARTRHPARRGDPGDGRHGRRRRVRRHRRRPRTREDFNAGAPELDAAGLRRSCCSSPSCSCSSRSARS